MKESRNFVITWKNAVSQYLFGNFGHSKPDFLSSGTGTQNPGPRVVKPNQTKLSASQPFLGLNANAITCLSSL